MNLKETPISTTVFVTKLLAQRKDKVYSVKLLNDFWFFKSKEEEEANDEKFVGISLEKLLESNPHLKKLPPMHTNKHLIYFENAWCLPNDEDDDDDETEEDIDDIDFDKPYDTSSLHPEVISYINEKVKMGFYNHREIYGFLEDIFTDDEDVDPDGNFNADDYKKYCRYAVVQKMRAQKKWQTPTSWDKLAQAFDNLCQQKIIALHNAGNTISEGEEEISEMFFRVNEECDEEFRIEPIGYCFYHQQDVDYNMEGSNDLTLSFGNIEIIDDDCMYNNSKEKSVAIGKMIVNELIKQGFEVEWEEVIEKRINIINLQLQKKVRELEDLGERAYKYLTKPQIEGIEEIDYDNAVWVMLPKTMLPDWSGIYSIQSVETGNAQEAEDFMDEEEAHYGLACFEADDWINKLNFYNTEGLVWGEPLNHICLRKLEDGFLLAQVEYTDDEDVCDTLLQSINPMDLQWESTMPFQAIADNYIIFNAVHEGQSVVDSLFDDNGLLPQIEITLSNKMYQISTTNFEEEKSQTKMQLYWLR